VASAQVVGSLLSRIADRRLGARLGGHEALRYTPAVASEDTPRTLDIPPDWLADFEAAARRPLEQRLRYAFIHTYKPVLDDARYRSFETMEDYRRWCEENLPDWLGYGRV
jgi:hypothetical protein